MEEFLCKHGKVMFYKNSQGVLLALPCYDGGRRNYYNEPIEYEVVGVGYQDKVSVDDGVVVQAESYTTGGDRGEYCVIEHNDGKHKYWTAYLHLLENSLKVKQGDLVKKGDLLGKRGNTGLSDRKTGRNQSELSIWARNIPTI